MSNIVKNGGVVRLPPGFRFHPTDEELVVEYLKPKVFASPLPASIIPVVDLCKSDPWDLPGDKGKERYFFSTKEAKYPNGNRSNRATISGYWKATGKDKPIVTGPRSSSKNPGLVVGMKKTLVFYRGKPPHGSRTDWIMHEYRLIHSSFLHPNLKRREAKGDWVLCRIFLKKRNNAGSKNNDEEEEDEHEQVGSGIVCQQLLDNVNKPRIDRPVFYDLNLPAPCSSSSGSSDLTQLDRHHRSDINAAVSSSSSEDHEESSSCCHSFSSLGTNL